MRPSTSSTMRSQRRASRGSCVTIRNAVAAARVEAAHQREDLVGRMGVEVAGRLVGQHQRRRERQRARDRHALLLAAGELARQVVEAVARDRRRAAARAPPRAARASRARRAISPGISTFSVAVNAGSRWWNWNTKPMLRRAQRGDARSRRASPSRGPASRYEPAVGGSSRPIRLSSVDLPEPDGPISAANSPRREREVDAVQHLDLDIGRRRRRTCGCPRARTSGAAIACATSGSPAPDRAAPRARAGARRGEHAAPIAPPARPTRRATAASRERRTAACRRRCARSSRNTTHHRRRRARSRAPSPRSATIAPCSRNTRWTLPRERAHRAQDADLAPLLHDRDDQHAGDAERDDQRRRTARIVRGRDGLRVDRGEQLLVGLHPRFDGEAGLARRAAARCSSAPNRSSTVRSICDAPPGSVEQVLRGAEADVDGAPVQVAACPGRRCPVTVKASVDRRSASAR